MASSLVSIVCVLLIGFSNAAMVEQQQQVTANPIRKVVVMLQAMEKKVTEEGEKETELYEKFMCYCKNSDGALAASIADAEAKVGQLPKDIEAGESEVKQLKADLKQHQTYRAAAKAAMAEATTIREKEASAFASLKAEADANIAAATKATAAVEKGMSGSFLQTAAAQVLRNLVMGSNSIEDDAREELTAFLANGQSYAPASGQIVGILKQMTDTMNKDLAEASAAEQSAIKSYNELMAAKQKEVNALTKAIEEKMVRLGKLQVEIVEMKEDLDDTSKSLLQDKKFLAD
jgi:predicted  nucleic acid-binding Zn-ribbon protein